MTDLRPTRTIALLAAIVLLLAAVRIVATPSREPATGPAGTAGRGDAVAAGRAFLDAHLDEAGRVVRTDQGGDTVSEGQAWGLLVAVALEDERRAAAIVSWTEAHLARDDGLLAWRWDDGEVVDAQPASDADLVYGWALARGADVFGRPTWQARAERLVGSLADASVVATPAGPLLAAGPWATTWGEPAGGAVVNPSYLWPAALRWAEQQDGRLTGTTAATRAFLGRLLHDDTPLVPDWVQVDTDGRARAIGSPATPEEPAQHGLDAVRTWIWLAADCDPAVRSLAAVPRGAFARTPHELVAVHDLSGQGVVDWRHPATLAGAAAVAHAAGDSATAGVRLEAAADLQADHPTYYGAAVLALARLALETDRLGTCDVSG